MINGLSFNNLFDDYINKYNVCNAKYIMRSRDSVGIEEIIYSFRYDLNATISLIRNIKNEDLYIKFIYRDVLYSEYVFKWLEDRYVFKRIINRCYKRNFVITTTHLMKIVVRASKHYFGIKYGLK